MTNETKHTPGPWQAGRADMASIVDGVDSKWIYAGDEYVAIASGRVTGTWETVMANAHLIAAAPELYEALEDAVDLLTAAGYSTLEHRAALAKARGETL